MIDSDQLFHCWYWKFEKCKTVIVTVSTFWWDLEQSSQQLSVISSSRAPLAPCMPDTAPLLPLYFRLSWSPALPLRLQTPGWLYLWANNLTPLLCWLVLSSDSVLYVLQYLYSTILSCSYCTETYRLNVTHFTFSSSEHALPCSCFYACWFFCKWKTVHSCKTPENMQ